MVSALVLTAEPVEALVCRYWLIEFVARLRAASAAIVATVATVAYCPRRPGDRICRLRAAYGTACSTDVNVPQRVRRSQYCGATSMIT